MSRRTPTISITFLLRWGIQAIIAGLLAAVLIHLFDLGLTSIGRLLHPGGFRPVIWGAIAAVVVGTLIYRVAPEAAGEGLPAYLSSVRSPGTELPLLATVFKYPAALITLSAFGNGGVVGPLGRVVAGLSQKSTVLLQRVFPRLFADHREHQMGYQAPVTATISGLAAAIAVIFHSPIGSAVFAVEVIQKDQLRYHQIFPAILASGAALLLNTLFGWGPIYEFSARPFSVSPELILPVVLVGFLTGGMGVAYTQLYRFLAGKFRRETRSYVVLKLTLGMTAATLIGVTTNPSILGTSEGLLQALNLAVDAPLWGVLPVGIPLAVVLILLIVTKLLGNCLTVASGMSAGFMGPSVISGMLAGHLVATIFGFPTGAAAASVLLVSGFAGMLASTMNVPLAASIMAMEVFAPSYGIPAGLAAMIAFQTARYNTIYDVVVDRTATDAE